MGERRGFGFHYSSPPPPPPPSPPRYFPRGGGGGIGDNRSGLAYAGQRPVGQRRRLSAAKRNRDEGKRYAEATSNLVVTASAGFRIG